MSHPYQEHRGHKVEKSRAHRIAGGALQATGTHGGGGAPPIPMGSKPVAPPGGGLMKRGGHVHALHGKKTKHRMDRKHRKSGGRATSDHEALKEIKSLEKHEISELHEDRSHRASGGRNKHHGKGKNVTNVIVAPQGGGGHPMPPPMQAGPPMMPPPRPPMPPPGAGGPPPGLGGAPGGMPPGMPPRKRGGRVGVRNQGPGDHEPKQSAAWREGNRHKTQVQHSESGKTEAREDLNRGKPITFRKGGKVEGASVAIPPLSRIRDPVSRAVHQAGPVRDNTSRAVKPASERPPRMRAGSKSGVGRIEKLRLGHGADYP